MVTRLKPDGDGFSVRIDGGLLQQLRIDQDTPLEISHGRRAPDRGAVRDVARRAEFDRIVAEMNRRYDGMFKRLAE
jgi:hypothetical protein